MPDPSRETTCESNDNRRVECSMDTSGRVRMVRRLSNAPCIEGSTWGTRRGAVWVSNGCRAVFRSDGGGYVGGGSRPPDAAVRGCNAVEDWYGTLVRATVMRPGYWELILQYTDGQYVCEVDGSGRVGRFEKLRR